MVGAPGLSRQLWEGAAVAKCKECAFLAVRDEYSEVVYEATKFTREHGRHKSSRGGATEADLFCYRACNCFPTWERGHDQRTAAAVAREIACELFREWHPGLTPKEHLDMILHEELMRIAREREDADKTERRERETRQDLREEADREWRKEQAKDDRDWRKQESIDAAKRHRNELLILGLVAIVATCLTTLAAAVIERGYWWTPPEPTKQPIEIKVEQVPARHTPRIQRPS